MIAKTPRLTALIIAMSVLGTGGPLAAMAQEANEQNIDDNSEQNIANTEAVQTLDLAQDTASENQGDGNSETNPNIDVEQEQEVETTLENFFYCKILLAGFPPVGEGCPATNTLQPQEP